MQLLILFASFFNISLTTCTNASFPTDIPQQTVSTKVPAISYDSMKIIIAKQRALLKTTVGRRDYAMIEQRFVSLIVDSIFPYWYGTLWDFNGTTQTPGKGSIACGYFVSTVLRDAGISLNRVKTGQSASQQIIKTFADIKDIKTFSEKPLDSTLSFIKSKGAGLFIIGLDYHVGFIHYDGKTCWFIHSKWINPKAVTKENASFSGILYYSKYRVVGKISSNKALLNKWLN